MKQIIQLSKVKSICQFLAGTWVISRLWAHNLRWAGKHLRTHGQPHICPRDLGTTQPAAKLMAVTKLTSLATHSSLNTGDCSFFLVYDTVGGSLEKKRPF